MVANSDSDSKWRCLWFCRHGTATVGVRPVHLMNVE